MQTVFITGSNGLIGQKLVALLGERPAVKVIAIGRGPNRNVRRAGYSYESLDLTQADPLVDLVRLHKPDAIINCAAMSQADVCEQHPNEAYQANAGVVENLLLATRGLGTHILQLSTDFVFDGTAGPYKEADVPNPIQVYGKTKWEAEQMLLKGKQPYTILRTVLVYGTAPNLSRSNLALWVYESLRKLTPIRVVEDQIRTPTLAEDVADAVAGALFRQRYGTYHIAGLELLPVIEIARQVAQHFKLDERLITPAQTEQLNEPAKRPLQTGLIILKAQTELGYQPTSLSGGLALLEAQLKAG